jgi:hypothetical protein
LDVHSNNGSVLLGNIASGFPAIGFANSITSSNYALTGDGTTLYVNAATGGTLNLRINNGNLLSLASTLGEYSVPVLILAAGAYQEIFNTTNSGNSDLYFSTNNGSSTKKYMNFSFNGSDATNGALYFIPNNVANSLAVLTVQSGGNVGIGTTAPNAEAHIYGAGTTNNYYANGDATGAGRFICRIAATASTTVEKSCLALGKAFLPASRD